MFIQTITINELKYKRGDGKLCDCEDSLCKSYFLHI